MPIVNGQNLEPCLPLRHNVQVKCYRTFLQHMDFLESYSFRQWSATCSKGIPEYLACNGILHRKSAPYHPATNGLAKNMVKNVKQWLSKPSCGVEFECALSAFLRTYRNVPHSNN